MLYNNGRGDLEGYQIINQMNILVSQLGLGWQYELRTPPENEYKYWMLVQTSKSGSNRVILFTSKEGEFLDHLWTIFLTYNTVWAHHLAQGYSNG